MAYNKLADRTTNENVTEIANKLLEIMKIYVDPLHAEVVKAGTCSDKQYDKLYNIIKNMKDLAAFTKEENEFEELSEEEIRQKLLEMNKEV